MTDPGKTRLAFSVVGILALAASPGVCAERRYEELTKGIQGLIRDLESNDEKVRKTAVQDLGRIGPPAAVAAPALARALEDKSPYVAHVAMLSLALIGQAAIPPVIEQLGNGRAVVRERAAQALGRMGQVASTAAPALARLLEDEGAGGEARWALSEMGPDAVPPLARTLQSNSAIARTRAARALSKIGPPDANSALPSLVKALALDGGRSRVIRTIGDLGPSARPAVPLLLRLWDTSGNLGRNAIVYALTEIGPAARAATPLLRRALMEEDAAVCVRAAGALLSINPRDRRAAVLILNTLRDTRAKKSARVGAAEALGKLAKIDSRLVGALVKALDDENQSVRIRAVEALGNLGEGAEGAIPALVRLLDDDNMRGRAVVALGKIGRAAVPQLCEALNHESKTVRRRATLVLAEMGPEAAKAVPQLIESLSDEDKQICGTAADALGKIGPATEDVVPALMKVVTGDRPSSVQVHANMALAEIAPNGPEMIPALIGLMGHFWHEHRVYSARGLAKFGPEAKAALPALRQALEDEKIWVRIEAAKAIEKIAGAWPEPSSEGQGTCDAIP